MFIAIRYTHILFSIYNRVNYTVTNLKQFVIVAQKKNRLVLVLMFDQCISI